MREDSKDADDDAGTNVPAAALEADQGSVLMLSRNIYDTYLVRRRPEAFSLQCNAVAP